MKPKLFWLALYTLLVAATVVALVRTGQAATVMLTFTSPGDDGNIGTASQYDLRYSTTPLVGTDTTGYWATMTQVTGEPTPLVAGTTQSWSGTGFESGTYYWLLKTADEVPNWSFFSNGPVVKTVADSTAPAAVRDLR